MKHHSAVLDNKGLGNVVDVLKEEINPGSKLSVISAFFSIFAYEELKKELTKVDNFQLLLPSNPKTELFKENVSGTVLDRRFRNRLDSAYIARSCADWLDKKCQVKHIPSPIGQNLIHISSEDDNSEFNPLEFEGVRKQAGLNAEIKKIEASLIILNESLK